MLLNFIQSTKPNAQKIVSTPLSHPGTLHITLIIKTVLKIPWSFPSFPYLESRVWSGISYPPKIISPALPVFKLCNPFPKAPVSSTVEVESQPPQFKSLPWSHIIFLFCCCSVAKLCPNVLADIDTNDIATNDSNSHVMLTDHITYLICLSNTPVTEIVLLSLFNYNLESVLWLPKVLLGCVRAGFHSNHSNSKTCVYMLLLSRFVFPFPFLNWYRSLLHSSIFSSLKVSMVSL